MQSKKDIPFIEFENDGMLRRNLISFVIDFSDSPRISGERSLFWFSLLVNPGELRSPCINETYEITPEFSPKTTYSSYLRWILSYRCIECYPLIL